MMLLLRVGAASGLGALVAIACGVAPYVCEDHGQCVAGARLGRCEVEGYCSYTDSDCPGGARYSDNAAAGLAGACVPRPEDTASSTGAGSDDSASDDSMPNEPARCGNNIVETDEVCDDGNGVDGDGCSADCLASGGLVWSWSGAAGTTLTGLGVGHDGRILAAGNDTSKTLAEAFVVGLTATGEDDWAAAPLSAEGVDRHVLGLAVGDAVFVAGRDSGGPAGDRGWSARVEFDGTISDITVEDTSEDEGWGEVVAAANAALVGDRGGRARVRWIDDDFMVDWDLPPTDPWVAAAGRGDGVVAVVVAPVAISARWIELGRGGPPIGGGDLDGEPITCAFASDGGLVVAGQRGETPWVVWHHPDGSVRNTWSDSAASAVVAVTPLADDIAIVIDTGSLMRLDPEGETRWAAPTEPDITVRRLVVSNAGELLVGGTLAGRAWIGAHVP